MRGLTRSEWRAVPRAGLSSVPGFPTASLSERLRSLPTRHPVKGPRGQEWKLALGGELVPVVS